MTLKSWIDLLTAGLVDGRDDLKTKIFNLSMGMTQPEQKPFGRSRASTPGPPGFSNNTTPGPFARSRPSTPGAGANTATGTGGGPATGTGGGPAAGAGPGVPGTGRGTTAGAGGATGTGRGPTKVSFGQKRTMITCGNESHTVAPTFNTETEKLTHLIQTHTCPYKQLVNPPCKMYYEYDSEMAEHIRTAHIRTEEHNCSLCKMKFPTVAARDYHVSQSHVICAVCRIFFADYAALQAHNTPPCTDVAHLRPTEKSTGTHLTPVAKTELDVFRQVLPDPAAELSNSLALMASAIPGIPDQVRSDLVHSFAQYAALNKALAQYEKYPAKARTLKRSLLQCPNFNHEPGAREALQKASDFLSKIEMWEPIQSSKHYFNNFLKLQEINLAVTRATQTCALTERSATSLLLQKYSPETLVQLESMLYSPPHSWSYLEIIQQSQNLFYSLDLEDLAIAAESARRLPAEKFHEFFARAYTLLSTASLGRPEKERIKYISSNMRRLALRAAPNKIKLKIEQLELSHGVEYTSSDIADLVRSEEALNHPNHENQEVTLLGAYQITKTQSSEEPRRQKGKERRINKVGDMSATYQQPPPPETAHRQDQATRGAREPEDRNDSEDRRPTGAFPRRTDQQPRNNQWRDQRGPQNQQRRDGPRPFSWQHQGPPRPVSPGPFGPTLNARDMYRSTQSARARAQYVVEQKKLLGVPEEDQTKYCLNCGAGHPKLNGRMGEFHSRGKCPKVPYSTEVHTCPPPWGGKLFHLEQHCPYQNKNRLSNVIRILDRRNDL